MIDQEKVIKGLESQLNDLQKYADSDEVLTLTQGQAKDILSLLKAQEEKIYSVKEIAMDEATNATWREDHETWKVLDRIAQTLS